MVIDLGPIDDHVVGLLPDLLLGGNPWDHVIPVPKYPITALLRSVGRDDRAARTYVRCQVVAQSHVTVVWMNVPRHVGVDVDRHYEREQRQANAA
jgi:hypothetical protein